MPRPAWACCRAVPATLSAASLEDEPPLRAKAAAQQPAEQAAPPAVGESEDDVLALLPDETEAAAPGGQLPAAKAASAPRTAALDVIPAGTYATPAELLEPEAPADEPPPQQPADDLEAAVAAMLRGGNGQPPAGRPASASATSLTGSPRPARASSQLHLSLEAALADALGDLTPSSPSAAASCLQAPAAASAAWASPTAALLGAGRDGSVRLSSPWRTSSSGGSPAAEPEASKRYSVCGSACPALETIREQASLPSVAAAASGEEAAAACCSGGSPAAAAAQEERSCEHEAAAPGGGAAGAASSPWGAEGSLDSLDGVLALLEGGPCPPASAAAGALAGELGAAVAALLGGSSGGSPGQAANRPLSASVPAGVLGRLASVSSEEEEQGAGSVAEQQEQGGDRGSCAAAPAAPAAPAQLAGHACDDDRPDGSAQDSASSAESSWAEAARGSAAPTSGAGTAAAAAAAGGPARAPWAPPAWWTADAEEGKDGTDPLAQMYARAVREREERERRGARLRQQQADAELDGLTFRPTLATRGRRPGSAPCRPAPSSSLYDRERAHRQRLQERHAQQRRQQEEEALAGCTFRPAIDARSAQLCSRGVRYGHGRVHARGASPEGGACMDETVRQQLLVLHSAGMNAAAAAAMLSAAGAAALQGQPDGTEGDAPLSSGEDEWEASCSRALASLAGATLPPGLDSRPAAGACPASPGAGAGAAPGGPLVLGGSPVKASQRLYAHARGLQERQHLALLQEEERLRQEAAAAAPKAKPFPAAQHSRPPSVPLSRRSPPVSRPTSAPHGGQAAAAAAALGRTNTFRAASYWQRHGLEPGQDFGGFLQRQERFAARLEATLERRRAPPAATSPHLSPGSERILARRQQREAEAAAEAEAARQEREEARGAGRGVRLCFAGERVGAVLAPSGGSRVVEQWLTSETGDTIVIHSECSSSEAGAVSAVSTQAAAAAPAPPAHSHSPAISARAAALPARSPEQLHADWAARQERLAAARRRAEEEAAAACTFRPAVAPAGGRYASVQGRIPAMHDLAAYTSALRRQAEARQAAAAAAAREREARELAECTFCPNLSPPRCRSPAHEARGGSAAAAAAAAPPAAPPAPDVLEQVEALLRGEGVPAAVGTSAVPCAAAPAAAPVGEAPAAGSAGQPHMAAGQGPAAEGASFDAFLRQVSLELRRMQAPE